jgi:hypothetical protein
MVDVLISYLRKDIEFAQRLCHELGVQDHESVNLYQESDLGLSPVSQRRQTVKSRLWIDRSICSL